MTLAGWASRDDGGAARLVLLGALLMLLSLALPWVELRPNRLAAGEFLRLGWLAALLAGLVALVLLAWRRPRWGVLLANAALLAGVVGFGRECAQVLAGQLPIARAGASSGVWVWLLGASVAWWGARFVARGRVSFALEWLWLPLALVFAWSGGLGAWSVWQEGVAESARLAQEAAQHVRLTFTALACALVIGGPLAVWSARSERVGSVVLSFAGAVQALPSLALLGLLIAPLAALANRFPALRELGVSGIGAAPALVALTLYALLPIVRNGVVALRGVPPSSLDAARGMGMTVSQSFWRVELPLALPVWLAGVRQATVLLVGVTAVAALIGAGGLGVYIFRGLNASATDLILLGAIPASALAVLADALWRALEEALARRFGRGA